MAPIYFWSSSTIVRPEYAHLAIGLSFIGTDPPHERRGAASLLLQWGIEHCERDKAPAYLESTVDAGRLYERHSFEASEKISMVLDGTVEGVVEGGTPIVYSETCFIYGPTSSRRDCTA